MIEKFDDYRNYLQDILVQRQSTNKNYSLRSMAKQLGIAPSMLSSVLNGKRQLSLSKGAQLAEKLKLSEQDREYFLLLLASQTEKNPQLQLILENRLRVLNPERKVQDLSVEIFRLLSDWYHLVILELTTLSDFVWTEENVAKKVGISVHQVKSSLDLLQRLELIEKNEYGRFVKTHLNLLTSSNTPNQGLRTFHKQMLDKAQESIETQTPQEKYIGSETLRFDVDLLPELTKLANEFFDKAVALANTSKEGKDVYHMGLQCFRVTNENKEIKEFKENKKEKL